MKTRSTVIISVFATLLLGGVTVALLHPSKAPPEIVKPVDVNDAMGLVTRLEQQGFYDPMVFVQSATKVSIYVKANSWDQNFIIGRGETLEGATDDLRALGFKLWRADEP